MSCRSRYQRAHLTVTVDRIQTGAPYLPVWAWIYGWLMMNLWLTDDDWWTSLQAFLFGWWSGLRSSAFWSLQLWLDTVVCAGAAPSGSANNKRNRDDWKNRRERRKDEPGTLISDEYSHMPLGAPECLVAIVWAFPPPGIIRLDMGWPEGSGRANM